MQVTMTSLTSALTAAVRQSTSSNAVFQAQDETQSAEAAGTSQTTAASSDNAITGIGTGTSLLSAGTALDLIGRTQQVAETTTESGSGAATSSSATTDTSSAASTNGSSESDSSNVWPYRMQDVANDPNYASQVAERMGSYLLITCYSPPSTAHGPVALSPAEVYALQQKDDLIRRSQAIVNSVQQQARALYQTDKAQGKSSAQAVADILQLQLSQPQSYWEAMDPDHFQGDLKGETQDQLNELRQAMAKSAQSSSDVSPATGQTA